MESLGDRDQVQVRADQGKGSPPRRDAPWPVERLPLIGGRACLDFANTLLWRLRPRPIESLVDYGALLRWAVHAGVLDEAAAAALADRAATDPAMAEAVVARAIALREAIQASFVAAVADEPVDPAALAVLNEELAGAMARAGVGPDGAGGFAWRFLGDVDDLARPLWSVVRSAAELLVSSERTRVRQCGGEGCGWLFLDETRNKSRRWCEMATCGNRARVRAFARRQGSAGTAPSAGNGEGAGRRSATAAH